MVFNNNDDIKKFTKALIQELEGIGENIQAKELKNWDGAFFTTSSEFLGELKQILEKVKKIKMLDSTTKKDASDCIKSINRAFGM